MCTGRGLLTIRLPRGISETSISLKFATAIGIPMAVANFKLIEVSLMPLGKQIVRKPSRSIQVPVERQTTTGEPSQMP